MRRVSFFKIELVGGLTSWLDWAASSSRKVTEWPGWTFCPIVLQLAWWFNFFACLAHVQLLAACKPRATRKVQSWVPASLHNLKHFFTFSHTLPLHDSHLNIGLLIGKVQANLAQIKPTRWLIKFNLTKTKADAILSLLNFNNKINNKLTKPNANSQT